MLCPSCKADNPSSGRFCTACGSQFVLACIVCGFANLPSHRFCSQCGKALGTAATDASLLSARNAVMRRQAGNGERKRVTVLFADLKGSTAAIEGLDPEAALGEIDPAVEIMMRLVHRYEGVVCKRLGDGILALFGAPIADEDHAVRACFAALGMQRELREANLGGRVRVGLNSGEVLYRTITSELGIEVDAVGPVVHVAARMEQMAPPGAVYLTGETAALTQGLIDTRGLGLRDIKGASAPIEAHEAVDASLYVSRWDASSLRERAPFVGREAERAALETALSAVRHRRGSVIGISGEAGLGKSRLVRDSIGASAAAGDMKVLIAGAMALGRTIPYHALASALRDLFGISERDDVGRARLRIDSVLGSIDPALLGDADILASVISLAAAPREWLAMDPRQKSIQVRMACLRLVQRVAADMPLALMFEDLHWIDRDSEDVLRAVVQLVREVPLLVVLTYRSEYDDSWLAAADGTRLRMAPLSEQDVRRCLAEWFVEGAETERLIDHLTARTGGNPLFVEECVRDLAQGGALTTLMPAGGDPKPRRRYACWEAPDAIRIPPSVHDVLASRIDRRSPDCVALLRTLSMMHGRIPHWLASAVGSRASVETVLREAVAAEILVQASLYPDVEYVFAHDLLREVAHDSLTRARRIEAHRRIVEALEADQIERPQNQVELLAYHAAAAELWDKAALYQGQVAERALARGSYADAISGMRAALGSFEQASPEIEGTRRAIDQFRRLRALVYATGGDPAETRPLLARAEQLAERIEDRTRLGWVWADQSAQFWVERDNRAAVDAARRSLEVGEQEGDRRLQALALFRLGLGLHTIGDFVGAAAALERGCDLMSGDLRTERIGTAGSTYVIAGGYLVNTLCELGRFEEAERFNGGLTASASEAGDVYSIASAAMARCTLALARGDTAAVIRPLETLLEATRAAGAIAPSLFIESLLGRARFLHGDSAEAVALLAPRSKDHAAARGHAHGLASVWYAEALGTAGQLEEAIALLDDVERDAVGRSEVGCLVHVWRAKGWLVAQAGNSEQAEGHYRTCLARARHLSMVPLAEACEAALAALAAQSTGTSVERDVEV